MSKWDEPPRDEGTDFIRGLMWGVTFGFFVWFLIGVVALAILSA